MDIEKARFLMRNGRLVEAETELRLILADEPDHSQVVSLLSLCLFDLDRRGEGMALAERAVALDPMDPLAHSCLAHGYSLDGQFTKALAAANEAVRLAPEDPMYLFDLAQVQFNLRRWQPALETVEQALAIDPEDQDSLNLRARLLRQLQKPDDAAMALEKALANQPDDPDTLANLGWHHLEKGDYAQAKSSFLAALQLEPHNDDARTGLAEVLKAKNLLYRGMLRFELWMDKLEGKNAWFVIIGGVILYRALRALARTEPALEPVIAPLLVAYVIFVVLTWLHRAFFNMVLMFQPHSRLLLDPEERATGKAMGVVLASGILAGGLYGITGYKPLLACAIWLAILLIPLTKTLGVGLPLLATRFRRWLYAISFVAVVSLMLVVLGMNAGMYLIGLGVVMAVAFLWYYNFQMLKEH